MKPFKLFLGFVVTIGLLFAAPSQARYRPAASSPGDFDYFLLSLSLAPSFCALSRANGTKRECETLTEADFQQTPLTVHGLWPNIERVSVNRQPHDCDGPPLAPLPPQTQSDLRRYMPGGPGLERYEWRKHGACSGLSSADYFATIARLAQHANDTLGAAMRAQGMLGQSVRIVALLEAAGRADPALATAIVVDCQQPRGGGDTLIDEVRIVLSKDFQPMPAASVGLGQNSGCAGGRGFVPDVAR